jgi:hypothetical protein
MTANKTVAINYRQHQMKDRNSTANPQRAQESDAGKKQEFTKVNIIIETIPTGRQEISTMSANKNQ